ncbi:hypothetical protein [Nostoc sp.]
MIATHVGWKVTAVEGFPGFSASKQATRSVSPSPKGRSKWRASGV